MSGRMSHGLFNIHVVTSPLAYEPREAGKY